MTVQRFRGGETVPVGPFLDWFATRNITAEDMGQLCGLGPKWLRGKDPDTNKPLKRIPLHVVDRVLTTNYIPLWSVYPELYDAFVRDEDGNLDLAGPVHEVFAAFCPACKEMVNALRDDGTCLWCDAQTGGCAFSMEPEPSRRMRSGRVSEAVIREARQLYLTGLSMPQIANRLRERTDYATTDTFNYAMYQEFKRRGWPSRDAGLAGQLRRNAPNPCGWVKADGKSCDRSALQGDRFCHVHHPSNREQVVSTMRIRRKTQSDLPRKPFLAWLTQLVEEHGGVWALARLLEVNPSALWHYVHDDPERPGASQRYVVKMLGKARAAGISDESLTTLYGLREIKTADARRREARKRLRAT